MTKADIKALMKGLEKKAREDDVLKLLENIEEISALLAEVEDDEPRIRVPYVNATTLTTGAWK